MTTDSFIPIVLAGGKGERFWPLSRRQRPKQFLSLDGSGSTLLQSTAERLVPLAGGWENLWVVTASHLANGILEQLPQMPAANNLVEPQGRDTAPAVAWATLEAAKRYGPEAIVAFFPADHWIGDRAIFEQTIQAAAALARSRPAIVTLGIKPSYPAVGYGYIEQGDAVGEFGGLPGYRVSRFTEKPDRDTAAQFLETGRYSWNSGMFIFQAGVALQELRAHAPEILNPLEAKGVAAYGELPKISVDYALMEKTDLAYVLPAPFPWDDLGDWNSLERLHKTADSTNVELGTHIGYDTQGTIVYASDAGDVVVTLGLEDTVIVRDGNVTLVARKSRTQEIKKLLKQLQSDDRFETLL